MSKLQLVIPNKQVFAALAFPEELYILEETEIACTNCGKQSEEDKNHYLYRHFVDYETKAYCAACVELVA